MLRISFDELEDIEKDIFLDIVSLEVELFVQISCHLICVCTDARASN